MGEFAIWVMMGLEYKMSIKVGVGGKVHTRDFHRLFTQAIRVWVRVKLIVNGDRFMEAVEVNHDLPKSNK